jgi:hypothetical protein
LFLTSDVFLRKSHLNKGFIIPRSTMYFRCQIAKTLASPQRTGSTIESGWTECVETKRLRDAFPVGGAGRLLAIR